MDEINISGIFAPIYWGFVVSLFLGGITIVQAYIYFPAKTDSSLVRLTAMSMIVLDLCSSFLMAQSVYYYLIPHFGSLLPLDSVTPEISAECLLSTMMTFNSQCYFVYQLCSVKRLRRGRWLVIGSISFCAILAFAGGIACVASMYVFHHGVLSNRNKIFAIFFGMAKGFGALTDILATIAMCMFLSSAKAGISETNTLLNKLMRFVLHRGALVTTIQTALLITFYVAPNKLYWMAFHINVTKLYANTFFPRLNGRAHLQNQITHSVITPSFTTTTHTSHMTRNRNKEEYPGEYDLSDAQNVDNHFDMPTVTKSVVIADI
ncbi:hypothetical protein BDZ94DRAFT_1250903 [Collybia nuda]|uniref:DUF6534 domain-containing protein n=1 Tax=Collybia nuda TaxID=64659 RepID=A0A9P5YFD4_9AGAR|nr:hypothetical protein BDZ94DRAFT_1250903 [Collybia nuda]